MTYSWEFWPQRKGLRENQTKNGKVLSISGVLQLYKDEVLVKEWSAISGGWGKGNAPHGMYVIDLVYQLESLPKYNAYKKTQFPWVAHLIEPEYILEQGRVDLLIHPDGNLPGTLGCIGVENDDINCYNSLRDSLEEMKKQDQLLMLYVY